MNKIIQFSNIAFFLQISLNIAKLNKLYTQRTLKKQPLFESHF